MPVAIRLLTLAVAQLLDFGTFVPMVRWDGSRAEANPFVAAMLVDYGLPLVAVAKIALVVIVSAVVVILDREHALAAGACRSRPVGRDHRRDHRGRLERGHPPALAGDQPRIEQLFGLSRSG